MSEPVFQIKVSDDEAHVYVPNFGGLDERLLYEAAVRTLRASPAVMLGAEITGPSENIQPGAINGKGFVITYDLDYGLDVRVDDIESIPALNAVVKGVVLK